MELSISAPASNLQAPTTLSFVLGLIAAIVRSDLSIPDGAAKEMSIYLLPVIGLKAGQRWPKAGSMLSLSPRWGPGSHCPSSCYLRLRGCCV